MSIQGLEVLETAHQGQPQGDNFCYGAAEDDSVRVDFYSDLTCDVPTAPPSKFIDIRADCLWRERSVQCYRLAAVHAVFRL